MKKLQFILFPIMTLFLFKNSDASELCLLSKKTKQNNQYSYHSLKPSDFELVSEPEDLDLGGYREPQYKIIISYTQNLGGFWHESFYFNCGYTNKDKVFCEKIISEIKKSSEINFFIIKSENTRYPVAEGILCIPSLAITFKAYE